MFPFMNFICWFQGPAKMAAISKQFKKHDPMGKQLKIISSELLVNSNQTLLEWSLDGSPSELYRLHPRVIQDVCHQQT